jgi:hypothetical protein
MAEYKSYDKCKYCINIYQLNDGRYICKKKLILKSLIKPSRKICERFYLNPCSVNRGK